MTLPEIKTKYLNLRQAYSELVGSLYPGIVYKELMRLKDAYEKEGGYVGDLPSAPAPNKWGYISL